MQIVINISEEQCEWIKEQWNIDGNIVLNDYSNGDVIRMLFPPSVYFGEEGKHLVTFAKKIVRCNVTTRNGGIHHLERNNKRNKE